MVNKSSYNNNWMKTKKQNKLKQQILNTIPIFLAKTYKIVDNLDYHDIISWTEDGQGFIVKDINRLTTDIFPKHFKHSNFASFVRQLNMYGFHKVKSEEEGHVFIHQAFQKDQIQKLKDIKRRNGTATEGDQGNESNMMVPLRRNQQSEFERQLNLIKNKHEDLQSFVSMLVDQNKEILMQNRNFVTKMSKMQQKYRNKLETLMLLLLFGKAKNSNGQPFILPQQFQNMLQSFNDSSVKTFQQNEEGLRKKKQKREAPLKMLKNESEAQIQRKFTKPTQSNQKYQYDFDNFIQEIDSEKKEGLKPHHHYDDSIDLVPVSPNHSYIEFPELDDKQSHHDVSQFLDKLHHSDYEDLSVIEEKIGE